MSGSASLALRAAALAGLLLTIGARGVPAQEKVGIDSAVNTDATGTPPKAQPRRLVIGEDVVFNERITTDTGGQTQLLFLDESSMAIGPNSDLVIDQFVYDPKSSTGKLAMSATRGLLRYVGGKLSKQDEAVTLRTSTATLAVRGGAFMAKMSPNGATDAFFIYGKGLTVTGAAGGVQILLRPGYHVTINPGGQPSPPAPVPPGELTQLLAQLDGRDGGTGGASVIPTDATVANSGIAATISGNLGESLRQSDQNDPNASAFPPQLQTYASPIQAPVPVQGSVVNNITVSQTSAALGAGQVIDCISQNTCNPTTTTQIGTVAGQPVGGSNSVVSVGTTTNGFTNTTATTGGVPNPPAITFNGRLKNTNNPAQGFVDNSATNDIAYAGGQLVNGVFTGSFGNFGTITFPLAPGSAPIQGSSTSLGTFSGTSFLSADNTFFYATVTPTSQPGQRLFIFGGTPVNAAFYQPTGTARIFAFTVQPDGALQSNIPFIRSQAGGNLPNATVSPLYVVAPASTAIGNAASVPAARALQASLAINGQGPNQQSAIAVTAGTIGTLQASGQPIFNGQLRGSSLLSAAGTPVRLGSAVSPTVDGAGNRFYGGSAASGSALPQTPHATGANGTVGSAVIPSTASEVPLSGTATSYGFAQPALSSTVPAGVGASRTTQALSGNFGGLMYTNAQPTPYIATGGVLVSTDATTNRVQATLAGSAQSPSAGVSALTMQYGGLSGPAGAQAFVDNRTFAAAESQVAPQQITVNGAPGQPAGQLYFVSSGAAGAPASILPAGASYCQCQYLQWGYWGGDLTSATPATGGAPRIDRGHINTWVAGVATPQTDINNLIGQSATASYTGHAIGSVFNNGQSYVAAGGFNGTYNFGTQSGTLAINNFDGHSFAATGRAPLNGANYSFGVTTPGVKGTLNGTFYGPAAAETGGNFAVQTTVGPTYLASGVFAGKQ